MDPRLGREIELFPCLYAKRIVPGVDVAHGPYDAEFRRTVRIRKHPLARRFLPGLVAPNLSVAEEEPLIAGESLQNRRLFAFERQMIGSLGHCKAGEIGNVLTE